MFNSIVGTGFSIILLIFILLIIYSLRKNRNIRIMNASLTVEEMELRAKRTAMDHSVFSGNIRLRWPITRMNESYKFILEVYNELNDNLNLKKSVPPAADWLLDNFYIIEEQVKVIRTELTKKSYYQLPVLKNGIFKGYTRVFAIAMEFTASVDGQIDENTLHRYLEAYQSHTILFDREIRMIPVMIRIALIENVRNMCENILETQEKWNMANEIVDKWWNDDITDHDQIIRLFKNTIESIEEANPSFIEHLFYRLRRSGRKYSNVLRYIDEHLENYGITTEHIAQLEHNAQAENTVFMGNYIMSFKYISSVNWSVVFDDLSRVEKILSEDPSGHYKLMDIASRSYYVKKIEKLAKKNGVSELHITREALILAKRNEQNIKDNEQNENSDIKKSHIGYYLIDKGVDNLEKNLKKKIYISWKNQSVLKNLKQLKRINFIDNRYTHKFFKWTKKNMELIYIGIIIFFTALLVIFCYQIAILTQTGKFYSLGDFISERIFSIHDYLLAIFSCVAMIIPASEIVIQISHWLIVKIKSPAIFPRLELKNGIPCNMKTMVVMPSLLSNPNRVSELLENLESHYLSNREENLYFALIGAFSDSKNPNEELNHEILEKAILGVEALNNKHCFGLEERFHFYHRESVYNRVDDIWTGWERKRGALMEFNAMLLGSKNTSFIIYSKSKFNSEDIKYIITLDADTVLPLGMAKAMIGTMAHPLNLPIIDKVKNLVKEGYGLMQPRVSFDMESSNKSAFTRIFTGLVGMDPYAGAVSDIYQDMFDEGIFTGKGIYDLKVFYAVLKDVVPENTVLSHDLLEGSYVRAALVSDLELVDDYPSSYNSYITRLRRWIRGDWQLIPWLGRSTRNKFNQKIPNPLSALSIWKIFDNLRRSLVAPANIILLFLGLTILPGSGYFWLGFVVLEMLLPIIVCSINEISLRTIFNTTSKCHLVGVFGIKASFVQTILVMMFMPYQAIVTIKAVFVTLVRVFITKKNLLEWVTSDDAEKMQVNTLKGYIYSMGTSSAIGIILMSLVAYCRPQNIGISFGVTMFWLLAPFVAFSISKNSDIKVKLLKPEAIMELRKIARLTWRYFEEYSNDKNNFLAPDNFQVYPFKGIAYRTSPTNIGLGLLATITAHDFGYLGVGDTIESIGKTIDTVEKLDKWHGHLLNWYDTRTLKPLEPKYVSTVDSGNFVCYLVTLSEGLKCFESKPIVEGVYINGIEDTLVNSMIPKYENFECFSKLAGCEKLDVHSWYIALAKFAQEMSVSNVENHIWESKAQHMAESFIKEIETFMPWIPIIEETPKALELEGFENVGKELRLLLCENVSLKKIMENIEIINQKVETLRHLAGSLIALEGEYVIDWLDKIEDTINISEQNIGAFLGNLNNLIDRVDKISQESHFIHLYDEKRELFSIGLNLDDMRLTNSYYDLLASEARQTSYLAIARGEVPAKHWNRLGRSLTMVDRYKGLISWSGTMFEYFMPLIIMQSYKNTLLDETYSFVIKSQKKYGSQRDMPWGVSESAYNDVDLHLNYQYKAIGVPWLGLKRGLMEDAVVAPYATFMALMVDPVEAYKNIQILKSEGLEGHYGYYESIDYTPGRLSNEGQSVIIKSYMAHHQGMTLMSLSNYINENIIQKRFLANASMKAANLLLQEKVPTHVIFTEKNKEKIIPYKGQTYKDVEAFRIFTSPDKILPKAHVLSNGYYSVVTTDRGTGYSRTKDLAVTRWREDAVEDNYGMFFYLKHNETQSIWSSAYAPFNIVPENYEVVFTGEKTAISRRDGEIDTLTEIVVTSGDNAEVRRIKVKNNGESRCTIELTSYFEIVLADQNSDVAHPAFSNLFIETEFNTEFNALMARRRPRKTTDKDQWIAQIAVVDGKRVGEYEYETDRMKFIGRGNSVKNPVAMAKDKPLTNTLGTVLDPVFSLRIKLELGALQSSRVSFVTLIADGKEAIMELLQKYNSVETCDAAFWLAVVRNKVENRYLNIKACELELYQNMVADILYLSPMRKNDDKLLNKNHKFQSGLWAYGISGDRPILMLTIDDIDGVEILYEIIKAHEYWRLKDLMVDLIILVNEENSYMNKLQTMVNEILDSALTSDSRKGKGDIFTLNRNNVSKDDLLLFHEVARMSFDAKLGSMETQFNKAHKQTKLRSDSNLIISKSSVKNTSKMAKSLDSLLCTSNKNNYENHRNFDSQTNFDDKGLQFFNGFGGFNKEGDTYVIHLENDQMTPLPWSNVVANKNFGFITTESGGGYTWFGNSRENKLTPWSNDSVCDEPGEIVYISEDVSYDSQPIKEIWTITALPIREVEPYTIEHGFGYTKFEHTSHGITQTMTQFVPLEGNVKISLIELRNDSPDERILNVTYYVKPVIGVYEGDTAMHLHSEITENGALTVWNAYNNDYPDQVLFMDGSFENPTFCADIREFIGNGSLSSPNALKAETLNNHVGVALDPCCAMQSSVTVPPLKTVTLVFVLGISKSSEQVSEDVVAFKNVLAAQKALLEVKVFWKNKLTKIQVKTPDSAMNIMMNGWLLYQVITCRIWARTAFYQAGGAFGFRDQLQDCLALLNVWPELAREQILKHAAHQFLEGDVLHWWHEPAEKGPRTRISDDYLWLAYVTAEYVTVTGDSSILEEVVTFIEDNPLKTNEEERYSSPKKSLQTGTLYEHCIRALDYGLKFGQHGLPLMGGGDWNDGMNKVGIEGRGESIWLGWFLYKTIKMFVPHCIARDDTQNARKYNDEADKLAKALNQNGWDGKWYRRAYFDDGSPLGTDSRSECKIDAIAQSWSVISGAGDLEKQKKAMAALEDYLVDKEDGLIKLLTPPFNSSDMEPGYIKGYVPGVRENGGQYTHAAIWAIQAFAKLGDGEKAHELFELINPIRHGSTFLEVCIYKAEPYVMAADVYSGYPHIGRGGWTWYTGSAGWMYQVGLEQILGFRREGEVITSNPNIPEKWNGNWSVTY